MKPVSASELVKGVTQLFSLPDIYYQLDQMIRDPRFSLNDIGKVVAKDPGLSARLLRVVNSSFYGFQARIDSISRAITVIGIDDLHQLIVATCVVDRFAEIPCDLVDMTAFWMRSVHCGVMAKLLAKKSAVLHSERLFLAGLLCDVGSLVIYQKLPHESAEILKAAGHDRRLLPELESQFLGFTHADVGRELIKSWSLPESLYEAIGCYLDPEIALAHKLDACLLYLSARLIDAPLQGGLEQTVAGFSEHVLALVRLDKEALLSIAKLAEDEFAQVFELLSASKRFY